MTKVRVGANADKMAPRAPAMAAAIRITQAPQESIRRPTKGAEKGTIFINCCSCETFINCCRSGCVTWIFVTRDDIVTRWL